MVERQQAVYSIEEFGGFVQISMDELISSSNVCDMETHDNIVSTIEISHYRLLLEYPRFVPSLKIGTALQINYPLCCPLKCALYIRETLILVANDPAQAKVFRCTGGKN